MSEQQPNIDRLLTEPEEAERVPAGAIPGLLARLASLQLRVAGLEAALLARLHATSAPAEADVLLDMETVAARLQVPPAYAYELGRRHELPIVRLGRLVRVRESSLRTFMRQREEFGTADGRPYTPPRPRRRRGAGEVVPLQPTREAR